MIRLLQKSGYNSTVNVTNTTLHLCVFQHTSRKVRQLLPFSVSVNLAEEGTDFGKLRLISNICYDLLHDRIDPEQATSRLKELEQQPPTYDVYVQSIAYVITAAAFVLIIHGSWRDVWLGFLGGCLTLGSVQSFAHFCPTKRETIGLFCAAFLPAVSATAASLSSSHPLC